MSVIAVQAGLADYVFASDPETARRAITAVSGMAAEGLAEARRLVTVLRPADAENGTGATEQADALLPRGIGDLSAMIERIGLAGLPVKYTVTGAEQPLPAGVGMCVYRVVQESLTNVLKHSPTASVEVGLHYSPREISVRIADDGAAADQPAPRVIGLQASGGGKGLPGMRERAALYGGTLTAGSRPEGGFEVRLRVPIGAK